MNMRKFFLSLLCVVSSICNAQELFGFYGYNSDNLNYLKEQSVLDPIEGGWSQEIRVQSWNNYRTFPEHVDNDKVCIIRCSKDELEDGQFYLEKLGNSNVYIYNFYTNNGQRFQRRIILNNGVSFEFKETIPTNYMIGGNVNMSHSYIKIFNGK